MATTETTTAAPVVERLSVERRETGSGRSMTVSYVITVDYANRPRHVTGEMSIKGLRNNLSTARVPEPIAGQLARYAGPVYLVEGRWTMVHPTGEGARLAAEVTREEVEEAHRSALRRLAEFTGGTLRGKPATEALVWEFTEARREAHRLERIGRAEEGWAAYHRAGALLEAARRFELADAEEASKVQEQQEREPREFRGLTREDVAQDAARALETLSAEDRATVEGKAPSVILGLAFRRAQTAWCNPWRADRTPKESATYERCANVASAALIFERADDPEAAATARADDFRITNAEREAERKRADEAHARALEIQWRGAERHGEYLVRTEDRGHGIVAVYVRGPHTEVDSIERASLAYAKSHGLRPGASAGGGEFFNGEYIAQCAYNRA